MVRWYGIVVSTADILKIGSGYASTEKVNTGDQSFPRRMMRIRSNADTTNPKKGKMKSKYQKGPPIRSIAEFEECSSKWFIVTFGGTHKTLHRAFLISWQYRLLKHFIDDGLVNVAVPKEQ